MDSRKTLGATIAATGSKVTYAGAGTSVAGLAFSAEFAAFVGLSLAVAGFLVNLYFRRREDRRNQQFGERDDQRKQSLYEARLRDLNAQDDDL